MIKLCLSDMDNTLIPFGEKLVSQRTIDAIHAVQEQGIDFGPCSGRNREEVSSFFGDDASCFNTAVLINGQKLYFNGQVIKEVTMDWEALRKVERIVADVPKMAFLTYRDDGIADWVGCSREEMDYMYDRAFVRGGEWHDTLPEYPVTKAGIVFMGTEEELLLLQERLYAEVPECEFAHTVVNWMDVTPHDWSKVDGVRALADALNFTLDEVCVFGDADNDLTMLQWVPNSCAVANANDNAKAAARYHVPASADDGVAWALEQIAEAGRIFNETGVETMPRFMLEQDGGQA